MSRTATVIVWNVIMLLGDNDINFIVKLRKTRRTTFIIIDNIYKYEL